MRSQVGVLPFADHVHRWFFYKTNQDGPHMTSPLIKMSLTDYLKLNIWSTWGSSCCGQSCDLFRPRPGFEPSMCTPVTPAVPYLLLGLQGVQWAVGNSCGARKLARTPHVNKKKKKKSYASTVTIWRWIIRFFFPFVSSVYLIT